MFITHWTGAWREPVGIYRAGGMTIDCSMWTKVHQIDGPCIRPGGPVLTERALDICSLPPGSYVADIGCGAGGTLEYLEQTGIYRSVGLDCSETLLAEATPKLVSGRLVQGRAETLPFKKGSFDALFCECVLSILKERATALHEFAWVLKQGGFLILSDVFNRVAPGQGQTEASSQGLQAQGLLAKEDLLGLLTGLGFSLLQWEEHESFLKEFVVRMILAGVRLPEPWACRKGQEVKKTDRARISYFLLVARKGGAALLQET
jgi:arsenite methyltransferase